MLDGRSRGTRPAAEDRELGLTACGRRCSGHTMAVILGFNLVLVAICGYALWRGGPPERWAAASYLIAAAATRIAPLPGGPVYRSLETEILIIDLGLLAVLLVLTVKADRFWPIWATAAHSTAVAVHLTKAINPELMWPLYATAASVSSIAVILILWVGTLRHRRRLKLYGSDRPWRIASRS